MAVSLVFEDGFARAPFLKVLDGGCASLGHVEDDESNLIYMRARYYAPTSGRFLSEDPQMQGSNWFAYCSEDPTNNWDSTGSSSTLEITGISLELLGQLLATIATAMAAAINPSALLVAEVAVFLIAAGPATAKFYDDDSGNFIIGLPTSFLTGYFLHGQLFTSLKAVIAGDAMAEEAGEAAIAVVSVAYYSLVCIGYIAAIDGTD